MVYNASILPNYTQGIAYIPCELWRLEAEDGHREFTMIGTVNVSIQPISDRDIMYGVDGQFSQPFKAYVRTTFDIIENDVIVIRQPNVQYGMYSVKNRVEYPISAFTVFLPHYKLIVNRMRDEKEFRRLGNNSQAIPWP